VPSLCGQGRLYFTFIAFLSTASHFAWISGCFFRHISTVKDDDWGELYIKRAPRSKHSVSVIKISQLMLYREIVAVCSQIYTKDINTLCGQDVELLNVKLVVHIVTAGHWRVNIHYTQIQPVPRSKHYISFVKTSQLMLCREIIAVCSQIHTKHLNTLCGQNVELVNVKPGATYSYYWALKG